LPQGEMASNGFNLFPFDKELNPLDVGEIEGE
jgi:hypothetical protein